MLGIGHPGAKDDEPFWSRLKTRNIARAVLVVLCLLLGLLGIALLMWHVDTNDSRGSEWAVSGVRLTGKFLTWGEAHDEFCAYVESAKKGEADKSPYATNYPLDGSVNIEKLCDALTDLQPISLTVTCCGITSLALWSMTAIVLAVGAPWKLRQRTKVIALIIVTCLLCLPTLITSAIWEIKFGSVADAGIKTSPYAGVFLTFTAAVLCFLAIPLAALDLCFVVGYENLNRYRWGSKDPMQMQRQAAAGAYGQQDDDPYYQQQQQQQTPQYAPAMPMGALLRPGEAVPVGGRRPSARGDQHGYDAVDPNRIARSPFGYGY